MMPLSLNRSHLTMLLFPAPLLLFLAVGSLSRPNRSSTSSFTVPPSSTLPPVSSSSSIPPASRHTFIKSGPRSKMQAAFGNLWEAPKDRIWNNVVAPIPPSPLPEDLSILKTDSLNTDYLPEVGNGNIATVVGSDAIFMNGLYNGHTTSSHRARIPSPAAYSIDRDSLHPAGLTPTFSLDLGRGIFCETYQGQGVSVTLRTYAHSGLTTLLVSELILTRTDLNTEVKVHVKLNPGSASEDIDFTKDEFGILRGLTREAEAPGMTNRTEFFMQTRGSLEGYFNMTHYSYGETYVTITGISRFKDFILGEVTVAFQSWEESGLLKQHAQHWASYWNKGRIDVEGDTKTAKLIYASLYYILSSLPLGNDNSVNWPFIGVSPGGLAHGEGDKDYMGHVFWDQDVWIFPTIAVLHPELGMQMVKTRTRTLDAARVLAKSTGYKGARFPWESAFSGLETCPAKPYSDYEVHISGDVILMLRQYWRLTQDSKLMFNSSGAQLAWDVADFWVSRTTRDPRSGNYSILDVMPPDEWHFPVNNSAYTNNIAAISLDFANFIKKLANQPENPEWAEVSAKLVRPYDSTLDYHPEFDGYRPSWETKQADVVLLAFPLQVDMPTSTRENDLVIYEKSTPQGPAPAMTWSLFLIGWLELGKTDKAADLLDRATQNAQEPFLVWSENADGTGALNFLTGMGGYLQSVLFGYGGCRIMEDVLTFDPTLMPNSTRMRFVGVNYRGCSVDLEYGSDKLTLTLKVVSEGHSGLEVKFVEDGTWEDLEVDKSVIKKRQEFDLRAKSTT